MKLYVLRHGEAEFLALGSRLDSDRRLTTHGRIEVASVLQAGADQIDGVDLIVASPYLRTQQTAEYVRAAYPAAEFQTWPELVPEADLLLLSEKLQSVAHDRVLLVSHQPLVGTLLSWLCGHEPGRYPMNTASFACLEVEYPAAGLAQCLWLRHAMG